MGMFDWVNVPEEVRCLECGAVISGWQTKDTDCLLETVQLNQVWRFYTICKCGAWTEYVRKCDAWTEYVRKCGAWTGYVRKQGENVTLADFERTNMPTTLNRPTGGQDE